MSHNTLYCSCKSYNYCFEWSSWVDEHFNKVTLEECPNCHDKLSLDLRAKQDHYYVEIIPIYIKPKLSIETDLKTYNDMIDKLCPTPTLPLGYINTVIQQGAAALKLIVEKVARTPDWKQTIYECIDLDDAAKQLTLDVTKHRIKIQSNYDSTEVQKRIIKYCKLNATIYTP